MRSCGVSQKLRVPDRPVKCGELTASVPAFQPFSLIAPLLPAPLTLLHPSPPSLDTQPSSHPFTYHETASPDRTAPKSSLAFLPGTRQARTETPI